MGHTLVIRLADTAPNFAYYCDPAFFPLALFDRARLPAGTDCTLNAHFKQVLRESDTAESGGHLFVPETFRVVLTSRPEGVRLQRYTDEFVIMTLRNLSDAQQSELISKQIGQNKIFTHLSALCRKRREGSTAELAEDDVDFAFFRTEYGGVYGPGLTEVR